jgi:hypothetical protein
MAIAHEPIHPGEILLEEFLNPMGITQYRLAQTISVPARRINEIVHGKRANGDATRACFRDGAKSFRAARDRCSRERRMMPDQW